MVCKSDASYGIGFPVKNSISGDSLIVLIVFSYAFRINTGNYRQKYFLCPWAIINVSPFERLFLCFEANDQFKKNRLV